MSGSDTEVRRHEAAAPPPRQWKAAVARPVVPDSDEDGAVGVGEAWNGEDFTVKEYIFVIFCQLLKFLVNEFIC